jgi:cbb3-type cytochrome oxidase subunit 3
VTERFAYLAFLTVVGVGLTVMTICLAAVWFFLLRQTRNDKRRGGRTRPPKMS